MKKIFYFVAVATLAFFSCQKETTPTTQSTDSGKLTFKASIEQLEETTKGTINGSNQLEWAENDLIGIYFPEWGDKNQPFRLNDGDAGKTQGGFTIATTANPSGSSATAAYYPYEPVPNPVTATPDYPSSSQNNVYEGIAYFKLKEAYWSYNSGKMLTPLVAKITSSSDNIQFKHAGAAVKLTLNNLATGTYKVKMAVKDQQITGDFHVNPANAGSEALARDGALDKSKNHITLNTWKSNGAFDWIFPVPELTTPKLQFEVIDDNGVTVWLKNLKAQSSNLERGDLLVLPAQTINPYEKFVQDDACEWSFSGNINGSAWQDDVQMMKDGKYWILAGCTFAAGDEFRIRKNKTWDEAYPEGINNNWVFTSELAGSKDIIFNSETHEIKVVAHSFPYPEPDYSYMSSSSSITIDGDMTDWAFINSLTSNSTGTSRIRSWKFTSDSSNLYFYFVLRRNRMFSAKSLIIGFNWDDSGSYSAEDYSGLEALVEFVPFTNATEGSLPVCVDGTINAATINGTAVTDAGIVANGSDPNPSGSLSDDSLDYYLEVSIPKTKIPSLPANGALEVGATYAWYETGLQGITL